MDSQSSASSRGGPVRLFGNVISRTRLFGTDITDARGSRPGTSNSSHHQHAPSPVAPCTTNSSQHRHAPTPFASPQRDEEDVQIISSHQFHEALDQHQLVLPYPQHYVQGVTEIYGVEQQQPGEMEVQMTGGFLEDEGLAVIYDQMGQQQPGELEVQMTEGFIEDEGLVQILDLVGQQQQGELMEVQLNQGVMREGLPQVYDLGGQQPGELEVQLNQALMHEGGLPQINDDMDDFVFLTYEELLALEEAMGIVSTGLDEETIVAGLKTIRYRSKRGYLSNEIMCCICQDEYIRNQILGKLECGHTFHSHCIKEWLGEKNECPLCKEVGLNIV